MGTESKARFTYEEYLQWGELQRGVIYLDGTIDGFTLPKLSAELAEVKTWPVIIKMCSNGGEAYAALGIYDVLTTYDVTIEVRGIVASAAAMIVLQAGKQRIAHPHTRFLVHEIRRWGNLDEETASRAQERSKELNVLTSVVVGILSKRCGKSKAAAKRLFNRKEKYMSAEEALKWGLIDEIVGNESKGE